MEQQTQQLTTIEPTSLISQAIDKGISVEALEKLMGLQERWEANNARKEFFAALSTFQSKCPEIRKNKTVAFNETKYNYAPLSDIERQIKELMHECGLTKRWETEDNGGKIVVTCIITHTAGHSEKSMMSADADNSGKKNVIQARASSITYMQRYTLIGALGIGTADNDIDGRFQEKTVDELHSEYMREFNQLIQIDSERFSKYNPDNWQVDRNAKTYIAALGKIRKVLFDIQNKQ